MSLNRRAFALVSLDCVIGSLPCTVDILERYDVFAGGKKGKPTTTSQSLYTVNVTECKEFSMLKYKQLCSLHILTYATDFRYCLLTSHASEMLSALR